MEMIDLRSDTLTQPTEEMLASIMKAKVGDDGRSKGLKGEDETVIELERIAADIFGKEDALFVPSGIMGNNVSILTHGSRGDLVVVSENNHIYNPEKGLFKGDLFGMVPVFVSENNGMYDLDELEEVLKTKDISVVCIENSHNSRGGTVISKLQTSKIVDLCKRYEVPVHLDGARIFNASIALETDVKELTKDIDSVMFCLSKGLSAPVGSMVVGSTDFIKKARAKRKLIGGQMRQVGVIAAPGIVALNKMVERLEEDNNLARELAERLSEIPGLKVDMDTVQTNIVTFNLDFKNIDTKQFLVELYERYNIRAGLTPLKSIRFVIYNGIKEKDITEVVARIKQLCKEMR